MKTITLSACDSVTAFPDRRVFAPIDDLLNLRGCRHHRHNDSVCPGIQEPPDLLSIVRRHAWKARRAAGLCGRDDALSLLQADCAVFEIDSDKVDS